MVDVTVVHYPGERRENWLLLRAAARKRDLRLITWAPHLIEVLHSDDVARVYYNGKPASPAVLIHRTVSPFRGILVPALACLAAQGTLVLNDPESAFRARDKLLTGLTLRAGAIPVVPTVGFDEPSEATFRLLGHADLILKPAHGVRGEGIETATAGSAKSIADRLREVRRNRIKAAGFYIEREHYLAQPLIDGGGKDVRAYVVGASCVALMRRKAQAGEVRANLALGASATPLSPDHPAARIAEAALSKCGLDFGGVDMLEDENGDIRVIEVDAWAGFAGIARITGVDVAGAILDYTTFLRRERVLTVILGIVENPYNTNVPDRLMAEAKGQGIATRLIDISSMSVSLESDGLTNVTDRHGKIQVDSVAPYLLFGFPAAIHALKVLSWSARMQNPVDSVLLADDKAATAERLARSGVTQVATMICPLDLKQALIHADAIGYPVVLKRTHGAQGRWVRRASNRVTFERAFGELEVEGPGALIIQPEVVEYDGRSVRAVVTGGRLLVATERVAAGDEFRSNIAGGASQSPTELSNDEKELAERAVSVLGLKHAGVDLLRTAHGSQVLEVNGCPDFTSMEPYFDFSLVQAVLSASV